MILSLVLRLATEEVVVQQTLVRNRVSVIRERSTATTLDLYIVRGNKEAGESKNKRKKIINDYQREKNLPPKNQEAKLLSLQIPILLVICSRESTQCF